jgi:hypothetical protein
MDMPAHDTLTGATGEALSAEELASGEDSRAAPRFTLMLRTAKLVGKTGEFLCIIRDISATGVRLRLFQDLAMEQELALELSNGDRHFVEIIWARDGEAGFRFATPIDVAGFITEASPYPRRQIRLSFNLPAILTAGDDSGPVMIHDISQQGAGIESDRILAIDQLVRLEGQGLPGLHAPGLYAKVRWRRHPDYGLVFEQTFRLDELARLAGAMQAAAAQAVPEMAGQLEQPPARYA